MRQWRSTAEMFVKIAKDYQNSAFENIKAGLNAALDNAKDFAETRVGSEAAPKDHGGASLDNFLAVLKGAAAEFQSEALELMKANAITTLEYARELAGTTTAAAFVELSSASAKTMRVNPQASRHDEVTCAKDNEVQR